MADLRPTREPRYDVVLDGGYFCDLLFKDVARMPTPGREVFAGDFTLSGGWTFRTAVALARLGIEVAWPADFGNDPFSRYVREEAVAAGVSPELFRDHDRPIRRITAAVGLPRDRAFISFMDRIEVPSVAPLVERYRPTWVGVAGLEHGPRFRELAASAKRTGTKLFMDCQDVPVTLVTPGVADAVAAVEVFSPNEREARRLTGRRRLRDAISSLAELAPTIVVKRGARGAAVWSSGRLTRVRALEVDPEVTTGAGDCFNAGFLYGVVRGADVVEATRFGNIVGALSTLATDGSRLPTEPELLDIATRWPT